MIWWFLILGVSTLVVVCVAIALYMRLRRHLQAAHAAQEGIHNQVELERQSGDIETGPR
jgi:membrane protein required for beta-lactamase induction